MHPKSLGNAGAETIGLNQRAHESSNVVNPSALYQVAESLSAGLAGAHLEVYQVELIAEIGVRMVQILANPHQRLIEREPGFHADHREVQRIGEPETNALLALLDHAFQDESGQEKAEPRHSNQQRQIVQALE